MKTPFEPSGIDCCQQHQSSQVGGHFRTTAQNPYERSGLASALEETLNPNSPLASALDRELGDKLATVFGIDIVLEDHLIDLLGKPPS